MDVSLTNVVAYLVRAMLVFPIFEILSHPPGESAVTEFSVTVSRVVIVTTRVPATLSPHFHKPLCCHLCQGQSGLTINILTVHKILLRITLEHFIQVFVNVTIQSARWTIHCTSARTAITICTIGIVCTACRVLVQMERQLPLWMVAATKNIQVITREYFDFFL